MRQTIDIGGRALEAGIDLFNLLTLLDRGWGSYRVAEPQLLEHVGQTTGGPGLTQPIFSFTRSTEWRTVEDESTFQLQIALRYRF